MARALSFAFALLLAACGGAAGSPPPPGGNPDGGSQQGGPTFSIATVDSSSTTPRETALALGSDGKLGVAYLAAPLNAADVEVRFARQSGAGWSAPVTVDTVQRTYGVALAFDAQNRAAVSYLGGGADGSLYWLQSDAVMAHESASGAFTVETVARTSADVPHDPNDAVGTSQNSTVLGLWPALAFDGTKLLFAWRDVHGGEFPTDYSKSDLEFASGAAGAWTTELARGSYNYTGAPGFGTFSRMVVANGRPAIVHCGDSEDGGGPATQGQGVFLTVKGASGWTTTQVYDGRVGLGGAALAWSPATGFGLAYKNASTGILYYVESQDGATWSTPDPVHGVGTGGDWAALAFDGSGNPRLAYYVCSPQAGAATCEAKDDELRLATRLGGDWSYAQVDAAGGLQVSAVTLPSGKLALAYRDPVSGAVKVATEQ